MKKYEVTIDPKRKNSGVYAISIVNTPAVQENFITLSKEEKKMAIKMADEEKRVVTGPALIPEKLIYRSNIQGDEGNIYFTKETIEEIMVKFMYELRGRDATLEHGEETDSLALIESWLIVDSTYDKAKALGYDLPVGTWMVSYKVLDDDLWAQIKAGEFQGFSIEGNILVSVEAEEMSAQSKEATKEDIVKEIDDLLTLLNS